VTTVAWELGSEFDWSLDGFVSAQPVLAPWDDGQTDICYLESGRQALALVSEALRCRGYSHLLMPQHFCESMIEPFVRDEWSIQFYSLDEAWTALRPTSYLPSAETTTVLNFPAFGVPESADWLDFLTEIQSRGGAVISDETHRVLSPGLGQADFRVASLRKMLPLPDGAFVTGHSPAPKLNSAGDQAVIRAEGMVEKSRYLHGDVLEPGYLPIFSRADERTHQQTKPAKMSEASANRIRVLDWKLLAAARARNAAALTNELMTTEYRVTTGSALVPSHAVVTGPDTLRLRRHLIQSRIYCPIHWVEPVSGPRPIEWRRDVLSIPIDQRYTPDDMRKVARTIQEFEPSGRE
jgi:hypothetical protein